MVLRVMVGYRYFHHNLAQMTTTTNRKIAILTLLHLPCFGISHCIYELPRFLVISQWSSFFLGLYWTWYCAITMFWEFKKGTRLFKLQLLSKARGMIFDKTKMVKNQELQIEALTTQVQSLKDINVITKDLLEIRNSEVKAMEVIMLIISSLHLFPANLICNVDCRK